MAFRPPKFKLQISTIIIILLTVSLFMKILDFMAYSSVYIMGLQTFGGKGPFLLFCAGKIPVNGVLSRPNYCVM